MIRLPHSKSGSKTFLENYRTILVLLALSKVFERIVYDQLSNYIERNNLLTISEFGFRKRYNTEFAVTLLTDKIRQVMDQDKLTGAVSIDLQKAFDTVEHSNVVIKASLLWHPGH